MRCKSAEHGRSPAPLSTPAAYNIVLKCLWPCIPRSSIRSPKRPSTRDTGQKRQETDVCDEGQTPLATSTDIDLSACAIQKQQLYSRA